MAGGGGLVKSNIFLLKPSLCCSTYEIYNATKSIQIRAILTEASSAKQSSIACRQRERERDYFNKNLFCEWCQKVLRGKVINSSHEPRELAVEEVPSVMQSTTTRQMKRTPEGASVEAGSAAGRKRPGSGPLLLDK